MEAAKAAWEAAKVGVQAAQYALEGERAALLRLAVSHFPDYAQEAAEAVAIGMHLAAAYSAQQGVAPESDRIRLEQLLSRFGLPTAMPTGVDSEAMLAKMRLDKKAVSGNLRLILWHGIGKAFIADNVDAALLQDSLKSRAGQA